MSRLLVAEFSMPAALLEAARTAKSQGFAPIDALTPYPLEMLDETLDLSPTPIAWPMLITALATSAGAYALEYATAVRLYPFNSGGRPLDSWPVFLLVPFEVGVLAAGIAGFVALLILCRLPRVDHPLLAPPAADRVAIDRFALIFPAPESEADGRRLHDLLFGAHAVRIGAAL